MPPGSLRGRLERVAAKLPAPPPKLIVCRTPDGERHLAVPTTDGAAAEFRPFRETDVPAGTDLEEVDVERLGLGTTVFYHEPEPRILTIRIRPRPTLRRES